MPYDPDITPDVLAERLARGEEFTILDVREAWEYDIAHLEPSTLLPLSQLAQSVAALDPQAEYITLCHHGLRSAMAANYLRDKGFTRVFNLAGGIDAWSVDVNPSLPRY